MTITWLTPSQRTLDAALSDAGAAQPSLELRERFDEIPSGFRVRSTREVVGNGADQFASAKHLIDTWAFLPGWIGTSPDPSPQDAGTTLLVVVNTLGIRWLLPTRILESVDDGGTRHGFVYAALDGHIAQGCERFIVEHNPVTGDVTFDITAVARPTNRLLRALPFLFPIVQAHFRKSCMRRLRRQLHDLQSMEART